MAKPSEIVSLLLNDDELANLGSTSTIRQLETSDAIRRQATGVAKGHDLWNDDGDEFDNGGGGAVAEEDEDSSNITKGKRKDHPPAKRGRKPGAGKVAQRKKGEMDEGEEITHYRIYLTICHSLKLFLGAQYQCSTVYQLLICPKLTWRV